MKKKTGFRTRPAIIRAVRKLQQAPTSPLKRKSVVANLAEEWLVVAAPDQGSVTENQTSSSSRSLDEETKNFVKEFYFQANIVYTSTHWLYMFLILVTYKLFQREKTTTNSTSVKNAPSIWPSVLCNSSDLNAPCWRGDCNICQDGILLLDIITEKQNSDEQDLVWNIWESIETNTKKR